VRTHPDWNYGYLRTHTYAGGVDPVSAVSGAVEGLSSLASAFVGLKSQREATAAAEKSERLGYKAQRETEVALQNQMMISGIQQKQAQVAQAKLAKTVITGMVAIAVFGALAYVGTKVLLPKA
jgi:hypothetical protein